MNPYTDPGQLYDDFAEYYDLWTSLIPAANGDLSYFQSQVRGVTSWVVELGVGNGRIAVALAESGTSVIGVDLSKNMLEGARNRAEAAEVSEYLRLYEGDFVTWIPPEKPVEVVYSPYHTLSHVLELERWSLLFANVYQYLSPGGKFCFNLSVPDRKSLDEIDGIEQEIGRIDYAGGVALVTSLARHDWERQWQQTDVHGELLVDGEIVLVKDWNFTLRLTPVDEVRSLALEAGFEIQNLSGSFESVNAPVVQEQIWTLRRPK